MNHTRILRSLAVAVVLVSVILLSGCSGGGGGGGGGHGAVLLITAEGASEPLWVNGTAPGACPAGVFINANIRFTFNAAVDPSSLPGGGAAVGSINIATAINGIPAFGTFSVEDDPAHPAGNQRVVVFRPMLPSNPASGCIGGIAPSQNYQVSLPTGQGLVVGGGGLTQSAFTCFSTCGCPNPGACIARFMDPVPGAPFVLDTTPITADPSPAPIDVCSISNNTVIIRVNEPLDPNGIDFANVRIINVGTGAQVPGTIVFHQAGNTTGTDLVSQIDYVASAPFTGSRTYQVVFGPGVKDLAGNPIQTAPLLFFQTTATPTVPQPPLVENFDTSNPAGTTGAASWSGDGALRATQPTELIGTGADGAFNPAVGPPTLLDTNQLVNGVSRQGVWNFTDVTILQGATVRIIGPYRAHFRCQGLCFVGGIVQVTPGQVSPPTASTPAYDKGAQTGQQQNGLGTDCEANGGVGNAGGGAGGAGSGVTPPPAPPPGFQCTVRALMGENGYGPTINGLPNNGTTPNDLYAGGHGGISGCFPSLSPCTPVFTELGGLGGAGGTAARLGEPGQPRLGTCLPNNNVTQPIAQPSPIPVAMIPPIAQQSAGSGGGGGGDHIESAGTPPNNDDQGGGGGGSGGGLRISCGGSYLQAATGQINASGSPGGNASNSAGAGGSGSGGEVWIQSFTSVAFSASSLINVTGPSRLFPSAGLIGCSAQASGGGGPGLVQVESVAPTPPNFNLQPTPGPTSGAVYSNPPFIYAGGLVTGQGRSGLRYTGVPAPDYTGAVEVFSLGNAASAFVTISYQGALEAPNSTPQNPIFDPATIKSTASGGGLITAANLDELDGYPFIEFIVDVGYAAPPLTPPSAILPSVDSITINFGAPAPCP